MSSRDSGRSHQHAVLDPASGLLHQPYERASNAPLDFFRGELAIADLQLVQARSDEAQRVHGDPGVALHQRCHGRSCPLERGDVRHRFRRHGIAAAAERRDSTERLTGSEQSQDDLVPFGRELRQLDGAGLDDEERAGSVSFIEERVGGGDAANRRCVGDVPQCVDVERREHRHVAQQLSGGAHHGSPLC
jgi:hypothetical protein